MAPIDAATPWSESKPLSWCKAPAQLTPLFIPAQPSFPRSKIETDTGVRARPDVGDGDDSSRSTATSCWRNPHADFT
jgi:hypothetical protein